MLDSLKVGDSNFLSQQLSGFQASKIIKKSSCLILHVHGGGFIAHSSKSHEIYLKPWCKELRVPIVSIDYSLAPEHVFPRASEECFYVYAWCLQNKDILGWTGEKIICVGDSAGGVLVTNIVQRAINNGIRIPDALVPIYAPFMLTFSMSPSRLMSVMDPLLNLGILWRCLAAYSGVDFKTDADKYKQMLNINENTSEKPIKKSVAKTALSRLSSATKTLPIKAFLSKTNSSASSSSSTSQPNTQPGSPVDFNDSKKPNFNDIVSNNEPISDSNNNNEQKLSNKNKERLESLHKILGDSAFLIEKLRNHPISFNQYMSPIMSDDSVLEKFPNTYLIVSKSLL